jgi:hypothetical protein
MIWSWNAVAQKLAGGLGLGSWPREPAWTRIGSESWRDFALLAPLFWNLSKLAYRWDCIAGLVLYLRFLIQDASHKNKLSFY